MGRKITVDLDRLESVIADWAALYPIPANGLDYQAQLFRIKIGLDPKTQEELRDDLAHGWAAHLVLIITNVFGGGAEDDQ